MPMLSDVMFRHPDSDVAGVHKHALVEIVIQSQHACPAGERTVRERGSGILVRCAGRACIMTNNHVLPTRQSATACEVRFVTAPAGDRVQLCPSSLWITSERPRPAGCPCLLHRPCLCRESGPCDANHLDFTVCALRDGTELSSLQRPIPISRNAPRPSRGSSVFILHPAPKAKHVLKCTQERLVASDDFNLSFLTHTPDGSSGSPIFNAVHGLAGLHRASSSFQAPRRGGAGPPHSAGRVPRDTPTFDAALQSPDALNASVFSAVSSALSHARWHNGNKMLPTDAFGLGTAQNRHCHAVPMRTIARNIQVQVMAASILDELLGAALSTTAVDDKGAGAQPAGDVPPHAPAFAGAITQRPSARPATSEGTVSRGAASPSRTASTVVDFVEWGFTVRADGVDRAGSVVVVALATNSRAAAGLKVCVRGCMCVCRAYLSLYLRVHACACVCVLV